MNDLDRFFRRLVSNLAAADVRRLGRPVALADIPTTIVPYRTNRRALQIDSSEEYEMVLLRLVAGEGGYVRTDPEEVRRRFEEELRSPNPDLEVIHRFEAVSLLLRPDRVDEALQPSDDEYHAPAAQVSAQPAFDESEEMVEEEEIVEEEVEAEEVVEPDDVDPEPAQAQCLYCGGALPDRPVNFCPHCGQSQAEPTCPQCHADVEPEWRHCVNCGFTLGGR